MTTDAGPMPFTFPTRVLAIPLVSSGIDTLHSTLTTSPYTRGVYASSQSIALSAYGTAARVVDPVYPHLQPVLQTADGYATKSLDRVEAAFPYPFHSTPTTIFADIKSAPEHARGVAKKTIDEKITTPAYGLATSVDHRLAPLVDLLESVLIRAHVKEASAASEDSSSASSSSSTSTVSDTVQITRAKQLLLDAKDHLITITAEQAKTLQAQNVYIQRASEHAKNVNATLATHYGNAQAGFAAYKGKSVELQHDVQVRVNGLSRGMLTELEKLQATTASLPSHIQTTLQPLTDVLKSTATELRAIIISEEPLGEKASHLGAVVQSKIGPIIDQGKAIYQLAVEKYLQGKETVEKEAHDAVPPKVNGMHTTETPGFI